MASPIDVLASATGTAPDDWEDLQGPDSGVGVDYWFRNKHTGAEAYANLDQDHLSISVDDEKVYDGLLPGDTQLHR